MRLFILAPLHDEEDNKLAVSMLPGATLLPGVTLYYEPDLYLGTPQEQQRPYFFRLADLNRVFRQAEGSDDRSVGRISPSLRVTPLEVLLRQIMSGDLSAEPLLMPPSETAELEYR